MTKVIPVGEKGKILPGTVYDIDVKKKRTPIDGDVLIVTNSAGEVIGELQYIEGMNIASAVHNVITMELF